MVIECCSQERSYSNFYGLVGERFCKLNRVWTDCFEAAFGNYYSTIHRYETNRLRNISRFFGHLMASDSISWAVLEGVKINEDDTTSSSRIFIKIMMNEMMESMGLKALAERFKDEEVKKSCVGMFPMDIPKNTRFAINYFTSIGMGIVTEEMREYLKVRDFLLPLFHSRDTDDFSRQNAPRLIMEQRRAMLEASSSSSDTSSDSDSDSDTASESDSSEDSRRDKPHHRRRTQSPPPRRGREDSRSPPPRRRTPSPPPRRGREDSRSPPPRRRYPSPSPPPAPSRYRDAERAKGVEVDRDRDVRRRESPPHIHANGRNRSPDMRDRRRDRAPPPPSSPPSRPRYAGRRASPSPSRSPPRRSPSRSRTRSLPRRDRDSRRSRSPLPHMDHNRGNRNNRSVSRDRVTYGKERDDRRADRSRERERESGFGGRRR
jgi:pre-mRNA-splicing factor CWC22